MPRAPENLLLQKQTRDITIPDGPDIYPNGIPNWNTVDYSTKFTGYWCNKVCQDSPLL